MCISNVKVTALTRTCQTEKIGRAQRISDVDGENRDK